MLFVLPRLFSCYHQTILLKQIQNYLEQVCAAQIFSGKSDSWEEAGDCVMQQNYQEKGMQLA